MPLKATSVKTEKAAQTSYNFPRSSLKALHAQDLRSSPRALLDRRKRI
ncbi:hypothetical protein HMPREF0322_04979 [Desulfitobacterium hafniense DP7]|uniref:Uncharacterized protein n=1 Tax=Desulfitobacterium hafniense DP7 TaxID=537010 RepID=G9XVG6_DESHA|nr:hypothetical protein HMPREF0322_04979 [Desulfitobacterium hafniense DP7]